MDARVGSDEALAEYVHMEEVRRWLLGPAGFREGKGLHGLLETLDAEGVDSVDLLRTCWPELQPMLRKGPAARVGIALGVRSG